MIENEYWRDVPGYQGYYQVSNLGRVKSLERTLEYPPSKAYPNGVIKTLKERIMTPCKDKKGYLFVQLFKCGNFKSNKVHRLVASAFLENPENLPLINHKDENKQNNRLENLEWCTPQYNSNYGVGKYKSASHKRIPVVQYTKDGELVREYESATAAAYALNKIQACSRNILLACRGVNKSAFGYHWKFKRK